MQGSPCEFWASTRASIDNISRTSNIGGWFFKGLFSKRIICTRDGQSFSKITMFCSSGVLLQAFLDKLVPMQNLAEPALRMAVKIRPGLTIDIPPTLAEVLTELWGQMRPWGCLVYCCMLQGSKMRWATAFLALLLIWGLTMMRSWGLLSEKHGVEMGKSFHLQRGLKMSRLAEWSPRKARQGKDSTFSYRSVLKIVFKCGSMGKARTLLLHILPPTLLRNYLINTHHNWTMRTSHKSIVNNELVTFTL